MMIEPAPFGMEQEGVWQSKPRRDNKYRYNGKELVNDLGLGMYLYGARVYLPRLNIFPSVDPLADKYPEMTPYNYVGNNPINAIDINGDSITPVGDQHLQMGIINWDRGVKAGNGYTLYGGTGTNQAGDAVQMWVASSGDTPSGNADYVMDVGDVSEFRKNSGYYKGLANFRANWSAMSGHWTDNYKLDKWMVGATLYGGGLLSSGSRSTIRNVDDIMANPSAIEGLTLSQVQNTVRGTSGWKEGTLNQGRSAGKGWTMRQMNSRGTDPTDLFIQYHPGTHRHFDGAPYWKVSSGAGGTQKFRAGQ